LGTFQYPLTLIGPAGEATIEAMVDTGATYSVIPRELLAQLGVRPIRKLPFELGDGRVVEYEVGPVDAKIDGEQMPTLCVFGEAGTAPLLGALTLEAFLLHVDPAGKRLVPARGYLLSRWIHSSGA
jgi:clan AA aspartic protease